MTTRWTLPFPTSIPHTERVPRPDGRHDAPSENQRDIQTIRAESARLDPPEMVAVGAQLRAALAEPIPAPPRIIVDLSAVEEMTSYCIRNLLDFTDRAEAHGGRLVIAGLSPALRRSLHQAGLDAALRFADSPVEAHRSLDRAAPNAALSGWQRLRLVFGPSLAAPRSPTPRRAA